MNKDKSIIVLTNFWDANILIDYGFLLHTVEGYKKVYKVNLINDNGFKNYTVNSISLSHPRLDKLENIKDMQRLNCFCPTYDLLCRYKNDKNWESYTKDYYGILKRRKKVLGEWLEDLKPNHVYFLCCWENTISGSKCHRSLIYKRLISSRFAMNKTIPIYRHGEKIRQKKIDGKIEITMPIGISSDLSLVDDLIAGVDNDVMADLSDVKYINVNVNGDMTTNEDL